MGAESTERWRWVIGCADLLRCGQGDSSPSLEGTWEDLAARLVGPIGVVSSRLDMSWMMLVSEH